MIYKSYIIEKDISALDNINGTLFYGENVGLKDDFKDLIKSQNKDAEQISIHQSDIQKNPNIIREQISNTSLFNNKKIIIVNDFTEKLKDNILEITEDIGKDMKIFLFSENLDRRSLVRSHFEKEKNLAIVPCYQDSEKTLSIYLRNKLKDFQGLSQDLINMLIKNSGTDRKILSLEIEKIKGLFLKKIIHPEKLGSLINNPYNVDFENLRDACLEANKKDLNKNLGNVSLQKEKAFFYLGSLNNRIQKLLDLKRSLVGSSNIDDVIDNIKPKIFWKDKPVIKKQMNKWSIEKLEKAKKNIFVTEMLIKTKLSSLSDVIIKKLLIELCCLADSNV